MEGEERPTVEERVAILESRVDQLAAQSEHANDLSVIAAREALTARQAHQRNIELLNALRKTQAEQTQTLADHTQTLADHTQRLADHTQRLDSIDGKLGMITVGVHTIETLLRRLTDEDEASR